MYFWPTQIRDGIPTYNGITLSQLSEYPTTKIHNIVTKQNQITT